MAALNLPQGWDSFDAAQKIAYFNQAGVTPDQLTSNGVDQASIDWMLQNGYNGYTARIDPIETPEYSLRQQQLAGLRDVSTKTVADKARAYNALQQSGLDDAAIRALATEAVGAQGDDAWNWLTSVDSVLDLPSTATVKDKVNLYNSLQGKGYTDADIRNIVQDGLGAQSDLAWNWLTAGDKVNDVLGGTVGDKAKVYNDLLTNSGLTEDQIRNVINDVAGQQTDFDMGWLKDAATIQKVSTGTAQQKADTYNQLLRAGRTPFEVRQITDSTLGQQSDSDWDALLKLANVGAATPDQQQRSDWRADTGTNGYQSNLIQSLRANNTRPYSNNPGVNLLPNPPAPEPSNWTPPLGQNSAFNPQVFTQQAATPGQVNDWNAYSAYRAGSVSGDGGYLSYQDWLNQGRPRAAANNSSTTTPATSNNESAVPGNQGP